MTLCYTEEAVKKNRQNPRGFHSLDQTEKCHILMSVNSAMPAARDNKHFKPGTTMGSALQNIGAPPDDILWKLTVGEKKQFYGNEARTLSTDADDK